MTNALRLAAPTLVAVILLVAPMAQAHAAPAERSFETRLMHDCIDDVPGSHDGFGVGYDLHALDAWEFWDSQRMIGFRVILNGNGGGTLTLGMEVDGDKVSFAWTSEDGEEWTSEDLQGARRIDDVYLDSSAEPVVDAQRFALVGYLPQSQLGGVGAVLSDFSVRMDSELDDEMPGAYNRGECERGFERPDYTIGEHPPRTAYIADPIAPSTSTPQPDQEELIKVAVASKVKALQQTATLRIIENTGNATVSFHDPNSGEYTQETQLNVASRGNPGSERLVHLAIVGGDGAAGTVTVEVVTDIILKDGRTQPGGRTVDRLAYEVGAESVAPPPPVDEPEEVEKAPSLPVALGSVALLAAAAWRRR